jgi:hypothetical protein
MTPLTNIIKEVEKQMEDGTLPFVDYATGRITRKRFLEWLQTKLSSLEETHRDEFSELIIKYGGFNYKGKDYCVRETLFPMKKLSVKGSETAKEGDTK